ncbi:MAG TPA: hypothetical protein VFB81_04785 [Myxococcales bacterium]|nr:hypothetical protein [Myxococcales bacterium]
MIARAALLLTASLLLGAGSADELTEVTVGAIKLKAPAAWQRRDVEGTTRFAAPSGEGYFDVDVGQVQRKGGMPADECLKKILAGLGKGYTKTKVGGQPAASKEMVDADEAGKRFVTRTYVGCNGTTTWSIGFHMVEEKRDRFAPVADQVFRSVEYQK